jgi:glycerophosphoryl diester phosphodiesterase
VRNRFLEGLRPTLHISHRGGSALAPENTLPAFRMAVERYRTQVLELDVHLSQDGEVVVAHDDILDRCTDGQGPIAALTTGQLAQLDAGYQFTLDGQHFPFRGQGVRIPLLRQVLRAFPDLRFNIEVKPGVSDLEKVFAQLIRSEGAVDRVCVGSAEDLLAAKLHQALPEACYFYPTEALTSFILSTRAGEPPFLDPRYTVLDMPLEYLGMRLFDEQLRDTARKLGRWINVWTIDDPAEMGRLVAEGVGGIMTDRPDLLRAVLDQH